MDVANMPDAATGARVVDGAATSLPVLVIGSGN
jgi:hypothetical protein